MRGGEEETWLRFNCVLPPGHLGAPKDLDWLDLIDTSRTHLSAGEWGVFSWPARSEDLVAVVTIENGFGGVLERWAQTEGAPVTKELDVEALTAPSDKPPTIAVAIRRRIDTPL